MLKHLKFRLLVLAGCCLLLPASTYADPVSISLQENLTNFAFTLTGSAVDDDFKYGQVLGTFWIIDFEIEEDDGLTRDEITVRFSFQHVVGQPGDPAGPVLSFQPTTIIGGISGSYLVVFTASGVHFDDEFDVAVGLVRFQVTDTQITSYSLEVNGQHAVPEPATLVLLGTGLAGVAFKARTKLKSRNRARH
jgi:PEP-CTERM motif